MPSHPQGPRIPKLEHVSAVQDALAAGHDTVRTIAYVTGLSAYQVRNIIELYGLRHKVHMRVRRAASAPSYTLFTDAQLRLALEAARSRHPDRPPHYVQVRFELERLLACTSPISDSAVSGRLSRLQAPAAERKRSPRWLLSEEQMDRLVKRTHAAYVERRLTRELVQHQANTILTEDGQTKKRMSRTLSYRYLSLINERHRAADLQTR